jgi:hypothetical protein
MRRRDSGLGWFLLGAGIGLALSAAAVMMTAELTRRRYYRNPLTGEIVVDDYDPVQGLAGTMQAGLGLLAGAASSVTDSFATSLREKIKFGLDPSGAGGGKSAWYAGDEEE